MHKGEDNASSSEDGKEQKNFNLSNKSHDQLKLRVGGLQIIFVLMLIHFNCVVLSGRTNKFSSELKYRKKCLFCSKILDSLMAWLGEKRKTEFS